jgi:hypothetical protein
VTPADVGTGKAYRFVLREPDGGRTRFLGRLRSKNLEHPRAPNPPGRGPLWWITSPSGAHTFVRESEILEAVPAS